MSFEWLPTVVTGAVGLGGIAGTWLTTRTSSTVQVKLQATQAAEERIRALREDRKAAYVEFLAAVEPITTTSYAIQVAYHEGGEPAEQFVKALPSQFADFYIKFERARLVCGDAVTADLDALKETVRVMITGKAYESPDRAVYHLNTQRSTLTAAMRTDLLTDYLSGR